MTLLITHPACLEHLTPPGHPERPERLRVIERVLEHEKFMFLLREQCPRPEPRLSTFERCWLGGATGRVRSPWRSGQATRATYSRSDPPDQSARSARLPTRSRIAAPS